VSDVKSPNPVAGRGLIPQSLQRQRYYAQLAADVGIAGPDYDAAAAFIHERYGDRRGR